jgi:threonine/homoserine/homoserine lactone efflux protein
MDPNFFLRGLIIGFSIAAPVGPIGVLCIHRTLTKGRIFGLISGFGAATADAIYGCIAGFGLTFVSSFLISYQAWFRLFGGGFLCYLGIITFFAKPEKRVTSTKDKNFIGAYASTLLLTLSNPMTILAFVAIFTGLGIIDLEGNYLSASILVLGVFLGSALWWFILSGGIGFFQLQPTQNRLEWINRISGIIITGFGLIILISLL